MLSPSLQQERARLLEEMARIDRMIRGHVSQQTYQVQRGERTVTQGPYHLLQRRENGRNNCQRVGADELDFIVQAVEGHDRFQELAQRYAALTEQMTWDQQGAEIKKSSGASGGLPPASRPLPESAGHPGGHGLCRLGSGGLQGTDARRGAPG